MDLLEKINEATQYIKSKINVSPEIGLILGSGLGELSKDIVADIKIQYSDIPNFPISTVKGHEGSLIIGKLSGKNIVAMNGRFHYYEGYDLKQVTFPIRVMKELGIKVLIITNAAGGINRNLSPGDLMIIEDHINFAFNNPLIGKNYDELGPRFPDMSHAYDEYLINMAIDIAKKNNIDIKKGTYVWMTGPQYETPAEVRLVSFLGGDAVGMSTVPEVITAVHGGIKVLGISCITNMAAGILPQPLNHSEVIETANLVKNKFSYLVKEIIKNI